MTSQRLSELRHKGYITEEEYQELKTNPGKKVRNNMTREEAITKYIVPAIEKTWNDKRCKEILEALEQEPCEDAISRQAVKELFQEAEMSGEYSFLGIDDLPPVTPQPKTGHWIPAGYYHAGAYEDIQYVTCSCCREDSLEEGDYCPNCGAKMEWEVEE